MNSEAVMELAVWSHTILTWLNRDLKAARIAENNTIDDKEFFLLSKGFKSVNRLSDEKAWIESNRTELVLLSYTFYRSLIAGGKISVQTNSFI